jgi:hypothetical protein
MDKKYPIIITSAAYVDQQLQSEFGKIPPSFLPVGSKRLYEHQYKILKKNFSKILISLPELFVLNEIDTSNLKKLKIEIIRVPVGLSLGNALVYLINECEYIKDRFSIMHGDSYLKGINWEQSDCVSIDKAPSVYDWGTVELGEENIIKKFSETKYEEENISSNVLTGWFSFSDANIFLQCILEKKGNFIEGLSEYTKINKLTPTIAETWLDFGHINNYYSARKSITTERSFNKLQITNTSVTKSSKQFPQKIIAEASWFKKIPKTLKIYTPNLLNEHLTVGNPSYTINYLHFPTLSEIYVFGRLKKLSWIEIFNVINATLSSFADSKPDINFVLDFKDMLFEKSDLRLKEFSKSSGISLNLPSRLNGENLPSLNEILNISLSFISPSSFNFYSIIHGDFCFSNMFYDNRAKLIYLVDPRGTDFRGKSTIFGDRRYDIAKLYHSIIGRYDHIIANQFHLKENAKLDFDLYFYDNNYYEEVQNEFLSTSFVGLNMKDSSALPICILIFLSMLPLHADDKIRQKAILANTLRLFKMLIR